VVLYGCGTWSLILKEKYRQRVFEKRVLRRIFGHKKNEVVGGWRKMHNDELNVYLLSHVLFCFCCVCGGKQSPSLSGHFSPGT
jgi:hypothetical protein